MRPSYITFATVVTFAQVAIAPDSCSPVPACWSSELACTRYDRMCNGNLCTNVCLDLTIPPFLITALQLQRDLQRPFPIHQTNLIGTHNSFISLPYRIGLEEHLSTYMFNHSHLHPSEVVIANQRLSVSSQLLLGIRHFELDIHFSELTTGHEIRVCHWDVTPPQFPAMVTYAHTRLRNTSDSMVPKKLTWSWSRVGCHRNSITMYEAVLELSRFLERNKREWVVVYVDNRVGRRKAMEAMLMFYRVFGRMLFTPRVLRDDFNGTWPTVEQLLARGYQVFLENNDNKKWHARFREANDTMWKKEDRWFEFERNGFDAEKCTGWGQPLHSLHRQSRALDTSLALGPDKLFYARKNGLGYDDLVQLVKCGTSIIALDQVIPKTMYAFVWTWDAETQQPDARYLCTAMHVKSGRWHTRPCDEAHVILCQRGDIVSPTFSVSSVSIVFPTNRMALNVCGDGSQFGLPRSALQNEQARVAASTLRPLLFQMQDELSNDQWIWLNHQTA